MTDTTRRGFFQLLAGAAIMPVIAKADIFTSPMTLWGDGLHDDTKALQALINGDVVEFANAGAAHGAGWQGKNLLFPRGTYKITDTLFFNKERSDWSGVVINFQDSHIIMAGELDYAIQLNAGVGSCTLRNLRLSNGGFFLSNGPEALSL